jgi:hypothetical protein
VLRASALGEGARLIPEWKGMTLECPGRLGAGIEEKIIQYKGTAVPCREPEPDGLRHFVQPPQGHLSLSQASKQMVLETNVLWEAWSVIDASQSRDNIEAVSQISKTD